MKIADIYNHSSKIELDEIKMSPKTIKSMASKIQGALVGIEFELVVRDFSDTKSTVADSEPDYELDDYVSDKDWESLRSDIINFFYGDYNTLNNIKSILDDAYIEYKDWKEDKWEEYVAEEYNDWHLDYTDDYEDIDEQPYLNIFKREKYSEFEESQGSIKNWLDDEKLISFKEWTKKYDLTWPHWIHPDPEDLRGYEEITKSFKEAVGMNVDYATEYHKGARTHDTYIIEPDSSVKPSKKSWGGRSNVNEFGLEFVSPPLSVEDAIEQINNVKHWAKHDGNAYTNSTTGLHMNISLPNYNIDDLDFIKLALYSGDEYILRLFDRESNEYARNSIEYINRQVKNNPELLPQAINNMKQGLNKLASKVIHQGYTQKTMSINVLENRVEFRSPGGDWLNMDLDAVINTMLRFIVALDLALDPEKEKREYTTKLYKILSANTNKDAIRLFIDYQQGELSKKDLKKAWAEMVLGLVDKPLSKSKEMAKKLIEPYLKNYSIVKLPEGSIVKEIRALNYDVALKQAFSDIDKLGMSGQSWMLYDHENPNKKRWYALVDQQGRFRHTMYSADPKDLYDGFSIRAKEYNIENWHLEPNV